MYLWPDIVKDGVVRRGLLRIPHEDCTTKVGSLERIVHEELKNLASKHPNLVIVALETTDPASIKAAAARVEEHVKDSGLVLLINNAGIARKSTLETETLEGMSLVYTTNVSGPLLVTQAFLPLLQKAAQGSNLKGLSCTKAAIINISSESGSIKNVYLWHLGQAISYRCSKAALNMLTKCQSLRYGGDGILCIAVHPGWVQTDMGNTATFTIRSAPRQLHWAAQNGKEVSSPQC
ncbi:uncharacterized protein [Emydura macquarii macquarii]|uniref:uncharacterized protein isoform X2 n=1 Tax=Emydura macquarii macquarii TaxID=1129001 RepID=UPI003529E47A